MRISLKKKESLEHTFFPCGSLNLKINLDFAEELYCLCVANIQLSRRPNILEKEKSRTGRKKMTKTDQPRVNRPVCVASYLIVSNEFIRN